MSKIKYQMFRSVGILNILLMFFTTVSAECTYKKINQGRIQWSESSAISAPNKVWQVEVHSVLTSQENETPVSLNGCNVNATWPLFVLERNAQIYWESNSENLLVINQAERNKYRLLLFNTKNLPESGRQLESNKIDELILETLHQQLGFTRQIIYYLPIFVTWNNQRLTLAIGGVTSDGSDGPTKSYCYGMVLDPNKMLVNKILNAKDLKSKSYGAECQIFP